MKKLVLKQLRAVQKMESTTGLTGRLHFIVTGNVEEHDKLMHDLGVLGWSVYRHYVQIGRVQVAILLD